MKIKDMAFARAFGASDLMLATMAGCYPPPHDAMDEYERGAEQRVRLATWNPSRFHA